MAKRLLLPAALGAIACAAAACVKAPEPPPAPAVAPLPAPAHGWLGQSPLQAKMRAMWISAGVIAQHAGKPEQADWDSVECAGDDIARKAAMMAGFWEQVRDAAKGMAGGANAGDWDAVASHNHKLWKGCCDCHVENWSPELRAFTPGVLQTWRQQGATPDAPWGAVMAERLNKPPREPYVAVMRTLNDTAWAAGAATNDRNKARLLAETKAIYTEADAAAQTWRKLERTGRNISALAAQENAAGIRLEYNSLSAQCIACHAAQVATARELLNPPAWP